MQFAKAWCAKKGCRPLRQCSSDCMEFEMHNRCRTTAIAARRGDLIAEADRQRR